MGRFDGTRVADLQELQGGSLAHESAVAIVLENAHMELDGSGVAELAERLGGSLEHEIITVVESTYEWLDGTGVADLAERPGGIRANVLVPALEARDLEPDFEFLDDRSEQRHRAASWRSV